MYFLRSKPSLAWTSTKRAPMRPVIAPKIIDDGAFEIGECSWVRVPNFRTAALLSVTSWPAFKLLRIASVSVEIAEAKKTSHNMLNVQKVVGFEISKQKRAPPIGDPKAAETPAAAPAAINCLFS